MSAMHGRFEPRNDDAWGMMSSLLSAILVWGGIGWLVDHWVGTRGIFATLGIIVGVSAALYLVFVRTSPRS